MPRAAIQYSVFYRRVLLVLGRAGGGGGERRGPASAPTHTKRKPSSPNSGGACIGCAVGSGLRPGPRPYPLLLQLRLLRLLLLQLRLLLLRLLRARHRLHVLVALPLRLGVHVMAGDVRQVCRLAGLGGEAAHAHDGLARAVPRGDLDAVGHHLAVAGEKQRGRPRGRGWGQRPGTDTNGAP